MVIIFEPVNGFHILAFLSNAYQGGSQYFCPDILQMIEPGTPEFRVNHKYLPWLIQIQIQIQIANVRPRIARMSAQKPETYAFEQMLSPSYSSNASLWFVSAGISQKSPGG
jgi:hypothetical protein